MTDRAHEIAAFIEESGAARLPPSVLDRTLAEHFPGLTPAEKTEGMVLAIQLSSRHAAEADAQTEALLEDEATRARIAAQLVGASDEDLARMARESSADPEIQDHLVERLKEIRDRLA